MKMKKLLESKYNNVVELIEETGKIPMMCIDDGEFEQLKNEIEALGYKCKLDSSTNYLLAEKMTREKIIEQLKEIGNITLDSKKLQDVMDLTYDYLEDMFKGFVADPNNEATEEELKDFQDGNYLVDIYFLDDKVTYTVGKDAQQLSNEPNWAEDDYDDIETETLAALLKAAPY
jgi:hypothetical protein